MPYAPINLTGLFVNCPFVLNAEGVYAFLKYIAEGCQINALFLELLWMGTPDIYPAREDRITFEILEPLLACPHLVYHNSLPNTIK
jgi:hypothetical protein